MTLSIQIYSFIFSFIFGIFVFYILLINHKVFEKSREIIKYISHIMLFVNFSLLYFLILKKLNEGIVHPYFLFFVFVGFTLSWLLQKKLLSRVSYVHCSSRH